MAVILASKVREELDNAFYPLTDKFLAESYAGIDLGPQRYCNVARKIAEAVYRLPLREDCSDTTGKVLDSNVRILAHLKFVDILELNGLHESMDAKTYISWVQKAAEQCFKILAKELALARPLASIYLKDPVRLQIDVKTEKDWSKAVNIPTSEDVQRVKAEIYSHPFQLCFESQVDVRGYMPKEAETLVTNKKGPLYHSFLQNEYIRDSAMNLEVYPHENPRGSIFSNFMEGREVNALKKKLAEKALTQRGIESIKENPATSENLQAQVQAIVASVISEEAKATVDNIEVKLKLTIETVVKEQKEIKLIFRGSQIAHVQDHYPLELIAKEELDRSPIQGLRDKIYQAVNADTSAKAPDIRYPRVSYYAKTREACNLLGAKFASEYMHGKNPLLQQLSKLLNIGIERHIRAQFEQQMQKKKKKQNCRRTLQKN